MWASVSTQLKAKPGGAPSKAAGGKGKPPAEKKGRDWRMVLAKHEDPGYRPEMLAGAVAQAAEVEAATFLQKRATLDLLSSAYLETAAAGFLVRAEEDANTREGRQGVGVMVARALQRNDALSVEDLMKQWDPNKEYAPLASCLGPTRGSEPCRSHQQPHSVRPISISGRGHRACAIAPH